MAGRQAGEDKPAQRKLSKKRAQQQHNTQRARAMPNDKNLSKRAKKQHVSPTPAESAKKIEDEEPRKTVCILSHRCGERPGSFVMDRIIIRLKLSTITSILSKNWPMCSWVLEEIACLEEDETVKERIDEDMDFLFEWFKAKDRCILCEYDVDFRSEMRYAFPVDYV